MSNEIVSAQILFKDIVIDEGLQFDNEIGALILKEGLFCYVPFMLQMHREIWFEEQLLVFYFSNDLDREICQRTKRRGKIIFEPIKSINEIPAIFEWHANIIDRDVPLPLSLLPNCYFIESKHFKKVLDLLVFS